jgi:hypothetical protein
MSLAAVNPVAANRNEVPQLHVVVTIFVVFTLNVIGLPSLILFSFIF